MALTKYACQPDMICWNHLGIQHWDFSSFWYVLKQTLCLHFSHWLHRLKHSKSKSQYSHYISWYNNISTCKKKKKKKVSGVTAYAGFPDSIHVLLYHVAISISKRLLSQGFGDNLENDLRESVSSRPLHQDLCQISSKTSSVFLSGIPFHLRKRFWSEWLQHMRGKKVRKTWCLGAYYTTEHVTSEWMIWWFRVFRIWVFFDLHSN